MPNNYIYRTLIKSPPPNSGVPGLREKLLKIEKIKHQEEVGNAQRDLKKGSFVEKLESKVVQSSMHEID